MAKQSHVIDIRDSSPPANRNKKHSREQHHAYFTATMVFLNISIFVVTLYLYHKDSGRWFEPFPSGNPNLGPNGEVLIDLGARDTLLIRNQNEWWRLISAMFLHAGVIHILFNMTCLWSLGAPLERTFGTVGIASIYLVSGLTGNLASAIFLPTSITVGASGAIYGLMGAFWADYLQNIESYKGRRCQTLITLIVICGGSLVIGMMPYADNFAHVGGFIGGLLTGLVLLAEQQQKGMAQAIKDAAEAYRRERYSYHGRETFDELVDACHLLKTALFSECEGHKLKLHALFDKYKSSKPGEEDKLTPQGLNKMLSYLGLEIDSKTRQHLGYEIDKNKDRLISWKEFLHFVALDDDTPDVAMENIEDKEIEKAENPPCYSWACVTTVRQYVVGLVAAVALVIYIIVLYVSLYQVDGHDVKNWCSWCHYVNCIETSYWDCEMDSVVNTTTANAF
jgi:membrane associated rhomboid family serine protease